MNVSMRPRSRTGSYVRCPNISFAIPIWSSELRRYTMPLGASFREIGNRRRIGPAARYTPRAPTTRWTARCELIRSMSELTRSPSVQRGVHRHRLQPLPRGGQETGGLEAVEHPVIEGEAEVHHRLDAEHPVDRNGPLLDRLHRQDAGLPRVDDGV